MKTVLNRYNYLIETRKDRIKHMENILLGKNKKYKYDLKAVEQDLRVEKQLLSELLTNDFYKGLIEKEKTQTLINYV